MMSRNNECQIVKLEYGSQEWLDYRKGRLGGSDASAVLGLNDWKDNVELWKEKKGIVVSKNISNNENIKFGKQAEEHITALFALDHPEYELTVSKDIVYVKNDVLMASLDGQLIEKDTGRKGIFESKTTNVFSRLEMRKWENEVPDYYYVQLLHYLNVTGWDFAVLRCYFRHFQKFKDYLIERSDIENDIKMLEKAEMDFINSLSKATPPARILPRI